MEEQKSSTPSGLRWWLSAIALAWVMLFSVAMSAPLSMAIGWNYLLGGKIQQKYTYL